MKNLFFLLLAGIFAFLFLSCSSKPTENEIADPKKIVRDEPTITIESKQLGVEQNAKYILETKFKKRSADLSRNQKSQIKKLISEITKDPKIEYMVVVSWADDEYPTQDQKKLSEDQKKLAADRNRSITSFIEASLSKKVEVQAYSMAERPTEFNEFIKSSEARIKKSLEVAGIPTNEDSDQSTTKASTSIIMAITK